MLKRLAIAAMALALVGCADSDGSYGDNPSSNFTPGTTTRAEAVAQLGPPASIYQLADGTRTVTWARSAGVFSGDTRSLSIMFGPDDRMIRIVSGNAPTK